MKELEMSAIIGVYVVVFTTIGSIVWKIATISNEVESLKLRMTKTDASFIQLERTTVQLDTYINRLEEVLMKLDRISTYVDSLNISITKIETRCDAFHSKQI